MIQKLPWLLPYALAIWKRLLEVNYKSGFLTCDESMPDKIWLDYEKCIVTLVITRVDRSFYALITFL